MADEKKLTQEAIDSIWRIYLTKGEVPNDITAPWYRAKPLRGLYRHLPDNPRCRLCYLPFKGLGGFLVRNVLGVAPSRLNPQICNDCERFAVQFQGGAEVEVTVLFADVRGSTKLAESMNPTEFSRLINRFYNATTKVLFQSNAMVEKLIGDEVTGFYTAGMSGENHAMIAIEAARAILRATGHGSAEGPWIPVGIGIHTGLAYIGSVNSDSGVTDIAVLGDTPNVGARLASLAKAGEICISMATAQAAGLDESGVEVREQTVKGRTEPVHVWVLRS